MTETLDFKSNEELYTSWWLEEMKETGYVLDYSYESVEIPLCDPLRINYTKHYLTKKNKIPKTKPSEKNLLQGHVYTPDFTVRFTSELFNVLYGNLKEHLPRETLFYTFRRFGNPIYLEVKALQDRQNTLREFKINQKWMATIGVFVNLFQPEKMFEKTFTPKRYYLTDKSMRPRKRKWEYKTLEEFIGGLK